MVGPQETLIMNVLLNSLVPHAYAHTHTHTNLNRLIIFHQQYYIMLHYAYMGGGGNVNDTCSYSSLRHHFEPI